MPSSRSGPRLDIRLLGPPEVSIDGRPIEVDTRKAIAILALLAAERRPFARDELAALLWPESDDAAARGALRRTLSTMRSAIGDGPLHIDRSRVALDGARTRVDLREVEDAMASGDRGILRRAADLGRGAFLAGFNLRDSPDFDDWRATRAVAAERSVLTILDRLAAVAEADGDLPTAIDAATRRLAIDPLDEAGHVRLMDLFERSGDRSAALRQYRACVAVLDRELGVPPLATTTARYEAIRDAVGSPPVVSTSPPLPPAPATGDAPTTWPLVGRDAELAAALPELHAARLGGRVVAIVGEAGIGKTRLGSEVTERWRADGAIVLAATAYATEREIAYAPIVDLLRSALDRPDGSERVHRLDAATRHELARLLPALAAPPIGTGGRPTVDHAATDAAGGRARLIGAIADGLAQLVDGPTTGVLWIDDLQWLDQASMEALEFLIRRPERYRVVVLVSWRPEDLDAASRGAVRRIAGHARATTVTLGRLDRAAVAALVSSAMTRAGSRVGDDALVDRLATASEGLPLYAVEVLADLPRADPDALPAGVRSVLRERLGALDETTRQVVSAASVIGRSFDLATVRHASGRSELETIDAVDDAVARGIVREAGTAYDFAHGALRELAYTEISLARRRLLHRRVAEALRLDLAGIGRDDLGRLSLIADHEREAGRDAEAALAYRAAGQRAAEVFANRAAITQLEAALALQVPDPVGTQVAIGRLRTRLGDYDGAIAALEAAAARSAPEEAASIEWALARAYLRRGDLAASAHHLDRVLDRTTEPITRAQVLVDRAVVERRRGDLTAASTSARTALAAATSADDEVSAGAASRILGLIALDSGDTRGAQRALRRAVEAADRDPDPTSGIAAKVGLAMALAADDDIDAAVRVGEDAAAACRRIGDRHLEAAVENHLADLLHRAGRDDQARSHQLRAAEAFAEVGGDPADPDPGIWMLSAT